MLMLRILFSKVDVISFKSVDEKVLCGWAPTKNVNIFFSIGVVHEHTKLKTMKIIAINHKSQTH